LLCLVSKMAFFSFLLSFSSFFMHKMSAKPENEVDHVSMSVRWCLPCRLALARDFSTAHCGGITVGVRSGVGGRESLSLLHLKSRLILSRHSSLFLETRSRYSTAFVQVSSFAE
jgi:hypothetical protein